MFQGGHSDEVYDRRYRPAKHFTQPGADYGTEVLFWVMPKVNTVNKGVETIRYRGPKTWGLVPEEIKKSKTLFTFKEKIKKWKPSSCTCRLCKTYIKDLGYL